jgi:hypothetical protein
LKKKALGFWGSWFLIFARAGERLEKVDVSSVVMVAVAPMLTRCFSLFFLSCSFAPTKESPDGNVANQPSEPDTLD